MPHATSDTWIDLCAWGDVPERGGRYVEHGNRTLAVFRVDGEVRVFDDRCPHAGMSLSAGDLDRETIDPPHTCVVCPWHGWAFDVNTGVCPDNEVFRIRVFESKVVAGRVLVKLADDSSLNPPAGR